MSKRQEYRPCVGVAVFNMAGQVWLGKRMGHDGPHAWQMPQGGIDKGEAPEHAAVRELFEETGITYEMITPLGEIEPWLTYDFPPWHKQRKGRNWRGQKQKWFAFRFHGKESDIDLKAHGPQEFSKWRWADLADAPDLIVPFKRDVYEEIAIRFARFAKGVNSTKASHG